MTLLLSNVHELIRELERAGVTMFVDADGGLHLRPADRLTAELLEQCKELKGQLIEHLQTTAEEIVIVDTVEDGHKINSGPASPELTTEQKHAANVKAAPRPYQGGEVFVNDAQMTRYGQYLRTLRKLSEAKQAADRGLIPRPGFYKTQFDEFD